MNDEPHIDYLNMGPWPMYLGFTMSPKAFRKELKRLDVQEAVSFTASDHANATVHFLTSKGHYLAIITMPKPPKAISVEQIAAMLAHEAVHVAQDFWPHIGERSPGKEAEAYLVQHIVQFCLQIALNTGRTRRTEP